VVTVSSTNVAYDPTRPCTPTAATGQSVALAAAAPASRSIAPTGCDPDGAYDPAQPCGPTSVPAPVSPFSVLARSAPPPLVEAVRPDINSPATYPAGERRPLQETSAQRNVFIAPAPGPVLGSWGIQVGAFANLATAQAATESARSAAPELLRTATAELPATTPFGGKVAFRARLVGLTSTAAIDACSRLSGQGLSCMTVPPRNTY
jgi:D-alanyl-D-alanine carboxypeptidase